MKVIEPHLLLEQWIEIVRTLLFPAHVFKEKRPDLILKKWSTDLSKHRENRRNEIDMLVGQILADDTPEGIGKILFETDPELVALFYDRLQAAAFALRVFLNKEFVEVPASTWKELASRLLYQKPFQ